MVYLVQEQPQTNNMKIKKITGRIVLSLTVLGVVFGVAFHYQQVRPLAVNKTPVISFQNPGTDAGSRPSMTEAAKKQADAPGKKQPTVQITPAATPIVAPQITDNAPKQTAIRQATDKEYTYYPLLTANDPAYASDWAVQKVNAPAAWDISTGNNQTVVAVIDTGFALNHEDLKNNWATNAAELGTTKLGDRCWTGSPANKSTNACDDDNNGYKDDWRGWNFYLEDNNPMAGRTNTSGAGVAHGTETSGLVGAAGNNGLGIATINWHTKIMPLQALSDDGPGYTSDIAAAVHYAVDNGANVINMSLGGSAFDAAMKEATDYAYLHNVVVVAAAGNCGTNTDVGCEGLATGGMMWPALNAHVISAGATTSSDQRASFSSYGPGLDVTAPGSGSIASPTWTPTNATSLYSGSLYGTSFASPQVASLASLIKSIRPNSSVDDITALLLGTATKLPAMNGQVYTNELGHGVINAGSALTVASSLNTTSATPKLLQAGGVTSEHQYNANDRLGSGCTVTVNSYCSVWLHNDQNDYDRYLPYQKAPVPGSVGWTWSGAILPVGEWQIRAVQGDAVSYVYPIGSK
jgi:subtilisin family serine protease